MNPSNPAATAAGAAAGQASTNGAMTALWIGAAVVVVLVVATWVAAVIRTPAKERFQPLSIASGSVRSMLGLLIVGAFVDFLLFGSRAFPKDSQFYDTTLTAFATLTGAVTGFYFGNRGAVDQKGTTQGTGTTTTSSTQPQSGAGAHGGAQPSTPGRDGTPGDPTPAKPDPKKDHT